MAGAIGEKDGERGEGRGVRDTDLKTTTGAEATISLALASAIALDSGVEEEEEEEKAVPISATGALYLYSRRAGERRAARALCWWGGAGLGSRNQ